MGGHFISYKQLHRGVQQKQGNPHTRFLGTFASIFNRLPSVLKKWIARQLERELFRDFRVERKLLELEG